MPDVCPHCPVCGAHPLTTMFTPYFCTDVKCRVLTWNPMKSADDNLTELKKSIPIDLTGLFPPNKESA